MKIVHLTCKWQGDTEELHEEWWHGIHIGSYCPRCGDIWPFGIYDDENEDGSLIDDTKTKELWAMWHK